MTIRTTTKKTLAWITFRVRTKRKPEKEREREREIRKNVSTNNAAIFWITMELNKAHTNNNNNNRKNNSNNNITNSLSRKREQTNEDCKGRTNSSSNPPSNPNRFKRSVTVFFRPPSPSLSLSLSCRPAPWLHLSKAPKIPKQKENRNAKEKITQNVTFELNLNEFCAWLCRRHAHTMVQGGGQTRRSTEQGEEADWNQKPPTSSSIRKARDKGPKIVTQC